MPPTAALIARDQRTGPRTALAGYRAGATIVQLCLAEDVSPQVVRRVLRRQEIPAETAERVLSLYQAGWTAKRIASDLGLQVKRVNDLVEARGVKRTRSEVASLANAARPKPAAEKAAPQPATAWPPDVAADVLGRYAAGEFGEEIAP